MMTPNGNIAKSIHIGRGLAHGGSMAVNVTFGQTQLAKMDYSEPLKQKNIN